nr:hypothetical protein B0A51_15486 [Rachicladosporium sp. CCFEE 5018]
MAALARSPATRALHLRITPRPSSIGESREVLRLISQFGEVEYFKSLKYEAIAAPDVAIVIFKDEAAARACQKKAPIRFRLGPVENEDHVANTETFAAPVTPAGEHAQPRGPSGAPFGMSQTRSLSTSSLPRPPRKPGPMPFIGSADPPPKPSSRIFQITTSPAFRKFRDAIDVGHYHGSFTIDTSSPMQEDLAKRVPTLGLSCWNWRKEDRPWRMVERERKLESTGWARRKSLTEISEEAAL